MTGPFVATLDLASPFKIETKPYTITAQAGGPAWGRPGCILAIVLAVAVIVAVIVTLRTKPRK